MAAHEVLAGDRLAVVALEVESMPPAEVLLADQGVEHADDLGALLVDRRGVEIVDLDIAVRAASGAPSAPRPRGTARRAGTRTSPIRLTAAECMSAENSWSRKTVRPSLRRSWNQSRQVTRLPVQLWKYSWAMTRSIVDEVDVGGGVGLAST